MNTLDAAIDTQENGFAVLAIPYDKGWSITVNGEAVKTYRVSGGLIGIALQQGHNEVHMQFVSRGFHGFTGTSSCHICIILLGDIFPIRQ